MTAAGHSSSPAANARPCSKMAGWSQGGDRLCREASSIAGGNRSRCLLALLVRQEVRNSRRTDLPLRPPQMINGKVTVSHRTMMPRIVVKGRACVDR